MSSMLRRQVGILFVFLGMMLAFGVKTSYAALPQGFTNQTLTTSLSLPTDFAFAPDGRIFIAQQNGQVKVFKNNQLLATNALTLPVGTGGDRGLLSVTFDPNFSQNSYVYLLYTSTALHERISRFTVTGDTININSETVLLENPNMWGGFLNAGAVRFGPDGKLYASFGSNGQGMTAQDLSSFEGKFVRINSDGSIPTDNPFYNFPGAQKSIYAYGLRNPWRFNFGPDGKAILGDVGQSAYDKIVRVEKGANYGWPTFEGDCRPNCNGVSPPLYVIPHAGSAGIAVVGGGFTNGINFPSQYNNTYFFGDYVQGYLKNITFDSSGNVATVNTFETGLGSIAGIEPGPDGCLYYHVIFPGELHKICNGINQSVTAKASADKTSGSLPLVVNFSSGGSSGQNLQYLWNFGDGTTTTTPNPTYTYTQKGTYSVVLTVTGTGGSQTSNLTIKAGYTAPTVTITSPVQNSKYNGGSVISFSATANDPVDGALPGQNFIWSIIPHHNVHIHTPVEFNNVANGTFTIPQDGEPGGDTWYEFKVTVTDSAGLSASTSVNVYPNLATISLATNPTGLSLQLDGQPFTAPYQVQSVVGMNRTLGAVSPQTINGSTYAFSGWSDGLSQNHPFVSPAADTVYTATFTKSATTDTCAAATNAFTGCYYHEKDLTNLKVTRTDPTLNFDWGGGTPDPLVGPDNFSARWLGNFNFDAASYTFTVTADDGIRVYLDNTLVLDKWIDQPATTYTVTKDVAAGTHTVKVEYFESYGNAVAKVSWAKNGGTSTPPPGGGALIFTDKVLGDKTKLTSTINATQDVNNALIDTEVYTLAGTKVQQNFVTANLIANVPYTSQWNLPALGIGDYVVKAGVFTSDWSKLYYWDDTALTFHVGSDTNPNPNPNPQPLVFAISTSLPKYVYTANTPTSITTNVAATQDVPNIHVLTEIFDSTNVKVGGTVTDTSLLANQQFTSTWNTNVPAQDGQYTVKVGVFSADYSKTYFWKNNGSTFTVGTPPSGPQPGTTYPITMIAPTNGSTVSGVVEIKSVINGLDINTYNIGWRTGGGEYFTLDTDVVTQSLKHAWIDFSTWTWNPNNTYPLEFQATDNSGNVIGHGLINITVQH